MVDSTCFDLMAKVAPSSIVLIEDFDSFFVDRTSQGINVSFSCLLNILDGTMNTNNGTIFFLTANNPSSMDSALVRPGRIDSIVRFPCPRKPEVQAAFMDLVNEPTKAAFAAWWDRVKGHRICMSGIIDFLFRHPDDYDQSLQELLDQTLIVEEIVNDKTDMVYT